MAAFLVNLFFDESFRMNSYKNTVYLLGLDLPFLLARSSLLRSPQPYCSPIESGSPESTKHFLYDFIRRKLKIKQLDVDFSKREFRILLMMILLVGFVCILWSVVIFKGSWKISTEYQSEKN